MIDKVQKRRGALSSQAWRSFLWQNRASVSGLLAGILALFVPLVRNFHLESAIAASLFSAIYLIIAIPKKSLHELKNPHKTVFLWIRSLTPLLFLALPIAVYDLITGCFSVHGLGFWLLIPLPAHLLLFSIIRWLKLAGIGYLHTVSAAVVLFLGLVLWMVEFFTLPQVFYYNPVWGYWPGPIYDETVTVPFSLLLYRLMTMAWALLILMLPHLAFRRFRDAIIALPFFLLLLGYANLEEWRLITTRQTLKQQLGSSISAPGLAVYYDEDVIDPNHAQVLLRKHQYYTYKIRKALQLPARGPKEAQLESFIYPHPWAKKRMVGAKYTSYVPVWLKQDQLHIAFPQVEDALEHEMVHVVAKEFGNELFNASWKIGLVEGIAVALAPDVSAHSTLDQLVAARKPFPDVRQMENLFSFLGFYTGRAQAGYLTAGSFVRFLLEHYEPAYLKEAYRTSDLKTTYPVPFDSLVSRWHRHLATVPVDSQAQARADQLFSRRSIFEKPCPHQVSQGYGALDQFRYHLAGRDTQRAIRSLGDYLKKTESENETLWYYWGREALRSGEINAEAVQKIKKLNKPATSLLLADHYFKQGESQQARKMLERIPDSLLSTTSVAIRKDSLIWRRWTQLQYRLIPLDESEFSKTKPPLRQKAVALAFRQSDIATLQQYAATIAAKESAEADFRFETVANLAEKLVWSGHLSEAVKLHHILKYYPSPSLKQQEVAGKLGNMLTYFEAEEQ